MGVVFVATKTSLFFLGAGVGAILALGVFTRLGSLDVSVRDDPRNTEGQSLEPQEITSPQEESATQTGEESSWSCFWPGSESQVISNIEGQHLVESDLRGSLFASQIKARMEQFARFDEIIGQYLVQKEGIQLPEGQLSALDQQQVEDITDTEQKQAALRMLAQMRQGEARVQEGMKVLSRLRNEGKVAGVSGAYCGPQLPRKFQSLKLPRFGSFSNQLSLGLAVNWQCPSCRQRLMSSLQMIAQLPFAVEVRVLGVTSSLKDLAADEAIVSRVFHCGLKVMPTKASRSIQALASSAVEGVEGPSLELFYRQFPDQREQLEQCEKTLVENPFPELVETLNWLQEFTEGQRMGWEMDVLHVLNGRVMATRDLETVRWILSEVVNEL